MPAPRQCLRELARYGGCYVWCEENDAIFASEKIAAVHSIKEGPRILKFPSVRTVWDLLTGEKIGDGLAEVTVNINPPETRLFYFGEESPY